MTRPTYLDSIRSRPRFATPPVADNIIYRVCTYRVMQYPNSNTLSSNCITAVIQRCDRYRRSRSQGGAVSTVKDERVAQEFDLAKTREVRGAR